MRRVALLAAFSLGVLVTACGPTSPTPRPPTATPQLFMTVIVTVPSRTSEPSWTPTATFTPPPTSTRLPSSTPRPSSTPVPTRTLPGGQPGVVTTGGLYTFELSAQEIERALGVQRSTSYFAEVFNGTPTVQLGSDSLRMSLNFNNMTQQGLNADFTVALRPSGSELAVEVTNVQGPNLAQEQIDSGRELLKRALLDQVIPAAIERVESKLKLFRVMRIVIQPGGVLITVRILSATPTASMTPTATATVPTFTPSPVITPTTTVVPSR